MAKEKMLSASELELTQWFLDKKNMHAKLEEIIHLYVSFLKKSVSKKLHSGGILEEAANLCLEIDSNQYTNDEACHLSYLIQKIAQDLLKQATDMSMTKQYDCSPDIKKYIYLAFDLAYRFCDKRPNRMLLPYLQRVIYYEKMNEDQQYYTELKDIFQKSLEMEQKYLNYLLNI